MDILLKDKPEFKEKVENNFHLQQDIRQVLADTIGLSTTERVNALTDLFTQFINQNYK